MRPLVLGLLLAACGSAPVPPASAPVRSPLLADGDLLGFEPADDLALRALRLGDPSRAAEEVAAVEALPPAERVAVLRAGIRLRDATAARRCAGLLVWNELDDAEQALTTRLLAEAVVDPAYRTEDGDRPDFGILFERASGAELPYVLDLVERHGATLEGAGNLSILHKVAHAEHLPQLARVALSPDAGVRRHALDMILTVAIHSDRHRDDVAAALLGLPLAEAQRAYPDTVEGVPPLLRAVLALDAFPFDPDSKFRWWAWRWLADARPAAHDAEFLVALGAQQDVVAWALRDVPDPRVDAWLAERVRGADERADAGDGDGDGFAGGAGSVDLAVLAHRGDRAALARLADRAQAGVGSETLTALLAVAPDKGREVVERVVFGGDAEAAFDMLGDVRYAWEHALAPTGIGWDDRVFAGFADAAIARRPGGALLATIGVSVPHCRTRALAEAAVAALPRDALPTAEHERAFDLDGDEAAFLETAAPEAFRSLLRPWTLSGDEATRDAALLALARIGDPPSAPLLLDAVRREVVPAALLARSVTPGVLAFLRERGTADFAAAVAYGVATGMPERVDLLDFCHDGDAPLPTVAVEASRAALLDGRWRDAVAHLLAAAPDRPLEEVGRIDDDRVRAYLQRLRERRELGLYPWATAELANAGDPAARAEYERALAAGRYRWADESWQITFHDAERALPFWIGRLETNCCRLASIRCFVFDHLYGTDFDSEGGRALTTPAAEARAVVERAGGRFVWSRLRDLYVGGSWVPAPR